jgi:hypothetical protein
MDADRNPLTRRKAQNQSFCKTRPNPFCHSERSEESSETLLALSNWILRCAQNDKPS